MEREKTNTGTCRSYEMQVKPVSGGVKSLGFLTDQTVPAERRKSRIFADVLFGSQQAI